MEDNKKPPVNEAVASVKNGMILFTVVLKNQALYPETNKIRQESMLKLRQWLEAFLAAESNLNLTVKKDRLLYQGEVVHLDRPNEQALIFPLYRDGVKWFEFHEGLSQTELENFINLLNRFRVLKDEAEDDLVTAMWEADLNYIKYKTADDFWGEDGESEIVPIRVQEILKERQDQDVQPKQNPPNKPLSDLFEENAAAESQPPPPPPADQPASDQEAEGPAPPPPNNVLEQDFGDISWKLSPEETAYVQAMINQDQYRYTIYDSLDILLVLLRGIEREQDIFPLVEFMTESVKNLLTQGELARTREYLERLRALAETDKPWLRALLAEFHKNIASEEVVSLAFPLRPPEPEAAQAFYAELYQLLLLLSPESVYALAPLMARIEDPYLEKVVLTVIAVKAGQVGQAAIPVANVLGKLKTAALLELVRLIRGHRLPWPTGFLEILSRHEQAQLRETALRIMLEQDPGNIGKLAHMIDDTHAGINQIICAELAKNRNSFAEKVLCDYLGDLYAQDKPQSEAHLMNCYRALGHCATAQAVPFLQNILLRGGWRSVLGQGGGFHRKGAALALMMLPEVWGTAEGLKKASRSPFKAIRQAYQEAEREIRGGGHV